MKILKRFFNKKDDGLQVGDGMILLFSMLAVTLMTIVGLNAYFNMAKQDNVTLIARQCIIKMETEGCLTESVKNEYIAQLEAAGCVPGSLDFTGTTDETSVVPFGGKIALHLKGQIYLRHTKVQSFRLVIYEAPVDFEVVLTSTSKC